VDPPRTGHPRHGGGYLFVSASSPTTERGMASIDRKAHDGPEAWTRRAGGGSL
jgi:hypothetical protein